MRPAPDMDWLIGARFVAGIGLGAEIVIGYATMLEFTPPLHRGRWAALLSLVTNFGLFASTLISSARHFRFRLAADVRHRRFRSLCRALDAQEDAGITALAGTERTAAGS